MKALAAAVVATLLLAFGWLDAVELPLRDAALRALPSKPAAMTAVVAIDERSLRTLGPWPWPRSLLARLVSRAADAGAKTVVLDVLLAEARPGDDELARAMGRVPTIAVSVLDARGRWLMPSQSLGGAPLAAHGNFELDRDGILRRFATTKQSRDRALIAMSVQAAALVTSSPVPVGRSIAPAFRTPPGSIPVVSAVDLLDQLSKLPPIVFIGPTALALGDRVFTPVSSQRLPDPGVTVHAAATESLIRGEEIRVLPPLAGGCAAGVFVAMILMMRRPILVAASLAIVVLGGGMLLLATKGIAIPAFTLLLSIVITIVSVEARGRRHGRER